jgi:hypothetical protein
VRLCFCSDAFNPIEHTQIGFVNGICGVLSLGCPAIDRLIYLRWFLNDGGNVVANCDGSGWHGGSFGDGGFDGEGNSVCSCRFT